MYIKIKLGSSQAPGNAVCVIIVWTRDVGAYGHTALHNELITYSNYRYGLGSLFVMCTKYHCFTRQMSPGLMVPFVGSYVYASWDTEFVPATRVRDGWDIELR